MHKIYSMIWVNMMILFWQNGGIYLIHLIICNRIWLYFDFRARVALGSLDDSDPLNMIHIFYI